MSKEIEDIRRSVNERLRSAAENTLYGTVEEVSEEMRTCKVRLGNVILHNVLLYSVEKKELRGFVFIPKKGSPVLISRIGGNRYYVEMFSEVDKVILTIGDKTLFEVTEKGFRMDRGAAGIKKTLSDLCDAICALTVTTAVGPSGAPINVAQFKQIKEELNDFLE